VQSSDRETSSLPKPRQPAVWFSVPVGVQIETADRWATDYPHSDGFHHGFAFPQRWCYDKPAAERHWERLISLYRRCLG
jgi:hypothetical protein